MKRFLAFLLLAVVFSSCDDGDLSQVSYEFDDTAATACSGVNDEFFIYKTQDKRALIIQLPEINFPNRISADLSTQPTPLVIDGSDIRVIYREYSSAVTSSTICASVPPSSPTVVQEREATQGTITITTTAVKSEPDANGATKIVSYLHTLVFKDLVFDLGDGNTQINETFSQVTYKTTATAFTSFAGLTGLFSCENDTAFLFKYSADQALVLDLNDADAATLFSSEAGPKTLLISAENKLTRFFFNTEFVSLTNAYFCTIPTPETPAIIDKFTAENGVESTSGIIEVTSLASDNGYKHTIVLKNMTMIKGTLKVQMGEEYIFGEFETTN